VTEEIDYDLFKEDHVFDILKNVSFYQDIVEKARVEYSPSVVAKYLLNLASLFNSFYAKEKVIVDDIVERNTKVQLLKMVENILNDGMRLLGMQIIKKM